MLLPRYATATVPRELNSEYGANGLVPDGHGELGTVIALDAVVTSPTHLVSSRGRISDSAPMHTDEDKDQANGEPGRLLEEEHRLLNSVLATAVDGIVLIDDHGIVRRFNQAAEKMFGYAESEVLGQNVKMLMPQPDQGKHDGYIANYLRTGERKIIGIGREVVGKRKDGSTFPMDLAVSEVPSKLGRQFTGIIRDISERRKAELELKETLERLEEANGRLRDEQRKLVQAEKLSSIGLLASGVAHEVNNPLSGVMACIKALSQGSVPDHKRDEYFNTAQEALVRIQGTVRGLLDFSRQREPVARAVNLPDAVAGCIRLATPALRKKNIQLVEPEATEQFAWCDRSQLLQALMNVILNAIHASPEDAQLEIGIGTRGPMVGVWVKDEGPGIPEKDLQRVCDPFFSTKSEGEGTGLGLAITQSIVRAQDGVLEINNNSDQGVTVTFWLPTQASTL